MKVRFAPSPTGFLHIGGARTALFNWMYARSLGGEFILRIEDTDQVRSKKEFEDEILDSMKWLGLNWDGLYHQGERFDLYREYAEKLVKEGKAYREGTAIILNMPQQEIKIYDLIRGEITYDSSTLKDQVLIKSDGSPAYSFCCVVDDALMEITCVVRGEDHIPNTPKQIIIYEALGFKVPKFAHLPLIMGEDGTRLSKRTGAVAVSDYRKSGFLPDALINYLMLLGWSPGNNQEIINLSTAVKKFSVKKINKSSAIFSMEKLRWINGEYIKAKSVDELLPLIVDSVKDKGLDVTAIHDEILKEAITLYKPRLATINDFVDWADFLFLNDINIPDALKAAYFQVNRSEEFNMLSKEFMGVDTFDAESVESVFKTVLQKIGLKPKDLIQTLRVALTGKEVGPSLFHIISLIGKDVVVNRLNRVF